MKFLYPIFLVIICILFNILISERYSGKPLTYDEILYDSIALAILNGDNYYMVGDQKNDIGLEVTPFHSAFVAIAYLVGGVNINNAYILNIVFNCLTIVLLFGICFLITQRRFISFVFSFLFIFYYILWRMNFGIMMEVTTVFFLSISVFLAAKFFYESKLPYLYLSALSFSFLCLINNRFIVILLIFFTFLIILILLKKMTFFKGFLIPMVIVILTISPWFIRQYIVYNQFVFFTPTWNNVVADKIGLFKRVDIVTDADLKYSGKPYNYQEYIDDLKSYNTEKVQNARVNAFTIDKYNEIIKRHNKHENNYLARLKKYFTLYYNDFQFLSSEDYRLIPPTTMPNKIIQILILLPMFLLSLAGFIISILKRQLFVLFLSALFFSHLLLHVLIQYIDRYRLTILPVLLIIATYGFTEMSNILRRNSFIFESSGKAIFKIIK